MGPKNIKTNFLGLVFFFPPPLVFSTDFRTEVCFFQQTSVQKSVDGPILGPANRPFGLPAYRPGSLPHQCPRQLQRRSQQSCCPIQPAFYAGSKAMGNHEGNEHL